MTNGQEAKTNDGIRRAVARLARGAARRCGTASAARWLALALCGLCLLLVASVALFAGLDYRAGAPVFDYWAECAAIALVFSPVGALIVARRPWHTIGWLFLAIGLLGAARASAAGYASYALLAGPAERALPGGGAAAWMVCWVWVLHHGLFVLLFLLFPDGRLPGPRWRWPARAGAAVFALGAAAVAFSPGATDGLAPLENPLGVGGLTNVYSPAKATTFALGFLAAASLFGRLHYATGKRRQQLKWCAYATAVLVSGATVAYTVAETLGVSWLRWPGFALVMAGAVGLPVAVAIAILRHNLFDIDLIIDLTLLYGVLTAALAGTIEGALAVLDHLFLVRVGQESEAAIFVSAVAIAIMFVPLHRRIEGVLGRVVRRPEDTVRRAHARSTFSDGRAREEEYPDGPVVGRAPGTGGEIALSERVPWGAGVAGDRGTSV